MVAAPVLVDLDRDSVAMGDDMSSHARRLSFPDGTRLADLLEATHPEIENRGWSWVAVVDGTESAVWSVDHGVRLLVRNRRLRGSASPIPVVFRYFLQLDPQWLHGRLAAGAAANRDALSVEYAPLAAERLEAEQRRREREVPEKLLSAAAVGALVRLGATIDLHSDVRCRFFAAGERWVVGRSDSMTVVYRAETPAPIASLRPRAFAELWLATAVGARGRQARGLPPLPPSASTEVPQPETMASWPPGTSRWSFTREDGHVAQLSGEDALDWYRFAFGRTLDEIVGSLAV
ncbi:hypothetical protein MicroSTF_06420 [Microbacterium sp. STF-2]|uniref:hypothetical protein n=1 Tax=Microbacterium sp. STF-2 TaxID=3031132 RepID=UPI0028E34BB6|nr:hypothetical protein [Microbacterium sp. STF-2]MEA1262656.1 hypothetical protein [Microbacterium sp. STF-2]